MALDTSTDVEEMRAVQNAAGEIDRPANESEQRATNDRLGNWDGLEAFWYETDTEDAEPLDSESVPEGVTVLVTYDEANDGNVYVGNEDAQPAVLTRVTDTFTARVRDTSEIYVRTPSAGDRVGVLFEEDHDA